MGLRQWILVGGLALVFIPAFRALAEVWSTLDYYSHGFLVPIVAYWIALPRIRRLGPPGAHAEGLLVLGAALVLYAVGLGLGWLARSEATVVAGLKGVAVVMLCMATSRMVGFVSDGEPNAFMILYLAAELSVMALALGVARSKAIQPGARPR